MFERKVIHPDKICLTLILLPRTQWIPVSLKYCRPPALQRLRVGCLRVSFQPGTHTRRDSSDSSQRRRSQRFTGFSDFGGSSSCLFCAGIEGTANIQETASDDLIGSDLSHYEICSFVALNWSRVSRESTFRLVNEIAIAITDLCITRVVIQMIETFRRCRQKNTVQTRF